MGHSAPGEQGGGRASARPVELAAVAVVEPPSVDALSLLSSSRLRSQGKLDC